MYTTEINRQIQKQLEGEEDEKVGTDRCIQLRTTDREIVRQRGGGEGRYRQMYTTEINKQREIVRQRGG